MNSQSENTPTVQIPVDVLMEFGQKFSSIVVNSQHGHTWLDACHVIEKYLQEACDLKYPNVRPTMAAEESDDVSKNLSYSGDTSAPVDNYKALERRIDILEKVTDANALALKKWAGNSEKVIRVLEAHNKRLKQIKNYLDDIEKRIETIEAAVENHDSYVMNLTEGVEVAHDRIDAVEGKAKDLKNAIDRDLLGEGHQLIITDNWEIVPVYNKGKKKKKDKDK